jgi:5-methylcytosine-specific restriction endonuclease McrA
MPEATCLIDGCEAPTSAKGFCKPHYDADYYQRTRERQRAQRRAWYEKNAEQILRERREDYAADPKKAQARITAWKAEHPEYFAQYWKRHYLANRARLLAAKKAYYESNKADMIERARRWAASNPEKRREIRRRYKQSERGRLVDLAGVHVRMARKRNAPGRATAEQLIARWNYFGGRCWMCWGPADQWDHVIPLSRGGANWPSNLRPACRCNQRKGAKRMAITSASFVPERRGVPASDNYSVGTAKNVDAAPASAGTDSEQHAGWEANLSSHPITDTPLPASTGAGQGRIMKGGRGGR